MSAFVKKYPAMSLLVLAMIFGFAPALAVSAGLLPSAWIQLGTLSSSLAAVVLDVIEGRIGKPISDPLCNMLVGCDRFTHLQQAY